MSTMIIEALTSTRQQLVGALLGLPDPEFLKLLRRNLLRRRLHEPLHLGVLRIPCRTSMRVRTRERSARAVARRTVDRRARAGEEKTENPSTALASNRPPRQCAHS